MLGVSGRIGRDASWAGVCGYAKDLYFIQPLLSKEALKYKKQMRTLNFDTALLCLPEMHGDICVSKQNFSQEKTNIYRYQRKVNMPWRSRILDMVVIVHQLQLFF